jgi:hypothetical protein
MLKASCRKTPSQGLTAQCPVVEHLVIYIFLESASQNLMRPNAKDFLRWRMVPTLRRTQIETSRLRRCS